MFPIRGKAAIWHPRAKLIFVKRTTVLQDSKAFCKEPKFLWKTPDKFITTMRRKMFFAAALCCIVSAVMVSCGKDNPDTPEPEPTPIRNRKFLLHLKIPLSMRSDRKPFQGRVTTMRQSGRTARGSSSPTGVMTLSATEPMLTARLSTSRAARRQVTLWMTVTMSLITRMSA